ARGVLFAQPHLDKDAAGIPSERLEIQGGDCFSDTLPPCDVYFIMQAIDVWNDQESVKILSAIRRSALAHAKLFLIEGSLTYNPSSSWIEMLDICMLALITGKERTRSEFETLLTSSGFRLDRVIGVGLGTSIIEASPI